MNICEFFVKISVTRVIDCKQNQQTTLTSMDERTSMYDCIDARNLYAAHNVHGTFDCAWDNALTLEGCMKHNYNNEELTLEPLRIGKHLYKCIYDWCILLANEICCEPNHFGHECTLIIWKSIA